MKGLGEVRGYRRSLRIDGIALDLRETTRRLVRHADSRKDHTGCVVARVAFEKAPFACLSTKKSLRRRNSAFRFIRLLIESIEILAIVLQSLRTTEIDFETSHDFGRRPYRF